MIIKDFTNFGIAYTGDFYQILAKNTSGGNCIFKMNLLSQVIKPYYYVDGKIPVQEEQDLTVSSQNGGVDNKIVINHYPFVRVAKSFFDARSDASIDIADTDLFMTKKPVIFSSNNQTISKAQLESYTGIHHGIEISDGKPCLVSLPNKNLAVFFSYSDKFSTDTKQASCSPFIGRIHGMLSADGGQTWTPPICVLNLSPFNPSLNALKVRFDSSLSYFDQDTKAFTNSWKTEFERETNGIRSLSFLTDNKISEVACQDFDVVFDNSTGSYILTFWYGGYICYTFISESVAQMQSMVGRIGQSGYGSGGNREPYYATAYDGIYSENFDGIYTYSKSFWESISKNEIFIVAGPVDDLLSDDAINSPIPKPTEENIAATILKAYGGSSIRNTKTSISYDNTSIINVAYDPYWQGVTPTLISIKFDNRDYIRSQPKQAPGLGLGPEGEMIVAFFTEGGDIAYVPVSVGDRQLSTGHPKLLTAV